MTRILIMTDSTCDLPADWVRAFDIRIVPTYVHFGLESLADDGVELTRQDFYERLASTSALPTTSAPPLGQTIDIMSQALADADHVIAITAPAALSGLHNIFRLARENTAPERVTIIDGQMVSMGLGWQVMIAAEMAGAGTSPAEIETAVLAAQRRTHVWAALDTLEYLRRSGRVGWAAAMIGNLLQIKPLVHLHQSVVASAGRVRTSQRAFDTLVDKTHQAVPLERLAVLHTNYPEGAHQLAVALVDIQTAAPVPSVDVTPVLGVHVGPNGLGLAVVRKESA